MNLTISPQLRLLLLLSLLGSVLLVGGMFFVMRAQFSAAEATPTPVVHRTTPETMHKSTTPAAASKPKPTAAKPDKVNAAKPSTAPAAKKAVTQPSLAARKLAAARGLPLSIAVALQSHRTVVAVLVVPGAELDTTVIAEARAAAQKAGVGFVFVNVLDQRAGRALAEKLGVVETPAVIVYRRPASVFLKLEGFVDRDTVAQAVANARGR